MLNVTEETKLAFLQSSSHKELSITFPDHDLIVGNANIVQESMELEESIMSGNDLEFIGCESNRFSIDLSGTLLDIDGVPVTKDLTGTDISVSIKASGSEESVPLFVGTVIEYDGKSNTRKKTITAYDALYWLGDSVKGEVDWNSYNTLKFPITIKKFRDWIFEKTGIRQESVALPADNMKTRGLDDQVYSQIRKYQKGELCKYNGIVYARKKYTGKPETTWKSANWYQPSGYDSEKKYKFGEVIRTDKMFYMCNKDFSAAKEYSEEDWQEIDFDYDYEDENITWIDLIKMVCRLNCVYGKINRYGLFTYIFPTHMTEDDGFFPGAESYLPMYPTTGIDDSTGTDSASNSVHYANYKEVKYETYKIQPITRYVIIDSSKDKKKGAAGTGKRKYIMQGNELVFGWTKSHKTELATAILRLNSGFTYQPFEATTTGLPYIECGDVAMFYVYDFINSAQQQKDIWVEMSFIILHRKLTGIQQLMDEISATGEKGNTHISGSEAQVNQNYTNTQIQKLQTSQSYTESNVENLNEQVEQLQANGLKVESVTALPASPDANTIYLIQGTAG